MWRNRSYYYYINIKFWLQELDFFLKDSLQNVLM